MTFKHHFPWLFSVESQERNILVTQVKNSRIGDCNVDDFRQDPRLLLLCLVVEELLPSHAVTTTGKPIPCTSLGEKHKWSPFSQNTGLVITVESAFRKHYNEATSVILSPLSVKQSLSCEVWVCDETGVVHWMEHPRQMCFQLEIEKLRSLSFT